MVLSRTAAMLLIPVGCSCSAAGLLLMKSATDERADLPAWRSPKWLFGFLLLGVFATVVEVAVLGVLPLSVVAPFAGLTIVFSLLLASSGLLTSPPESLSRPEVGCIGLVLLGVTAVSAFGPHDAGAPSLETLLAAYSSARFATFAVVGAGAASLVLCPCGSKLLRSPAGGASALLPLLSAFAAAACACLSQLFLKLISTAALSLPASAAPTALALLGLTCTAPLHLTLLNATLAGSAVSIAVPCYQFLLIVCTTAAGGVLFREFASQSAAELIGYALGVVTATSGLIALSYLSGARPIRSNSGAVYPSRCRLFGSEAYAHAALLLTSRGRSVLPLSEHTRTLLCSRPVVAPPASLLPLSCLSPASLLPLSSLSPPSSPSSLLPLSWPLPRVRQPRRPVGRRRDARVEWRLNTRPRARGRDRRELRARPRDRLELGRRRRRRCPAALRRTPWYTATKPPNTGTLWTIDLISRC
jgi:hypothetical protein